MPPGNPSPKLAITIAADFHEQVLAAAAVAEWEAEHGGLTEAELKAARQRLVSARRPRRTLRRRHPA